MAYHNRALIFEIISDHGFTEKQVDEVIKLAEAESGKFIQSPATAHRIIKFRNWFIISKDQSDRCRNDSDRRRGEKCAIPIGNLKIESLANHNFKPTNSNSDSLPRRKRDHISTDSSQMEAWRLFLSPGHEKKKKLARFFIDQKLSKTEKEKAWVIEMNKKIVWVVGMRIDDRFKITEKTKKILKISLETS